MPSVMRSMTQRRLRTVSAEQAIPPGQVEAEIAIGLLPVDRVVNAMHLGRHDDEAQHAIKPRRQADIAVVEHGRGVEQHLEDQHGQRRRAEHQDGGELDDHREDNLARMEAQPGGDIEFQIRVVHTMQPPQQRHGMKDHMLTVDRQIEQEHRDGDREPRGQRERC